MTSTASSALDSFQTDAVVWRRVHPKQAVPDVRQPGRSRASSGAFEDSTNGTGMSVHLPVDGESFEDYLGQVGATHDGIAVVPIRALYDAGFSLLHCPEPNDPRHFEVLPVAYGRKNQERKKRAIADLATLVLEPRK